MVSTVLVDSSEIEEVAVSSASLASLRIVRKWESEEEMKTYVVKNELVIASMVVTSVGLATSLTWVGTVNRTSSVLIETRFQSKVLAKSLCRN